MRSNIKSKQVTFLMIMVISVLVMVESLASVYYFQRGNNDYPSAVVQLWHGLKKRIDQSGIWIQPKLNRMYVNDDRFGFSLRKNSKPVRDN